MNCQQLVELIGAYVDDELTEEQRRTMDGHLGLCLACRRYLDSYRRTVELSKLAFEDVGRSVAEPLSEEQVAKILTAAAKRARGERLRPVCDGQVGDKEYSNGNGDS